MVSDTKLKKELKLLHTHLDNMRMAISKLGKTKDAKVQKKLLAYLEDILWTYSVISTKWIEELSTNKTNHTHKEKTSINQKIK